MDKVVCGVYIENEYITVARRESGSHVVDNVHIQPIDSDIPRAKALQSAFSELVKERQILQPKEHNVVAFSADSTHIFTTDISTEVEDVQEMLSWELMMRVNEPIKEYALNYAPLTQTSFMGVAMKHKEIKAYQKLFKKFKLSLDVIDVDLFAIANLFEYTYGVSGVHLIVTFEGLTLRTLLLENGVIRAIDHFSGVDESVDSAASVEKFREIITNYKEVRGIPSATPVYVTGTLMQDMTLRSMMLKEIPHTKLLNPFDTITPKMGWDEDMVKQYAPLVATAVGLSQKEL